MDGSSITKMVPFVAAAYIGIWVISFGYLIYLGRSLMGLNKQVKILSDTIKKDK